MRACAMLADIGKMNVDIGKASGASCTAAHVVTVVGGPSNSCYRLTAGFNSPFAHHSNWLLFHYD
jgi:hypothetical protein